MAITATDFDYVRDLVLKRSAIVLEPGKEYLVETRLLPVARAEGLGGIADLVRTLRGSPSGALSSKVVEAMTTNETSFFRDINPWDAFRTKVMPDLLQKREKDKVLNFWCAAASSGQEPYTVAIILRENFPQLVNWRVNYVATDLSSEVLAKARSGVYSQIEVNRGMPANLLVRYFQRQGLEWKVTDDLRRMVEFKEMNLIGPWLPMQQLDIVFIRNVLIYFDPPTKKMILEKIRKVLRPDGYLFLGGAEITINLDDRFERMPLERAGVFRIKS